jgi:uncharacterized protein (TIGR00297 family)
VVTAGIWESAVISCVAATVAYWRNFLTPSAAIAAALIGCIVLVFGGWDWGLAMAGAFLVTSLLSERRDRIEQNDLYYANARRYLPQVLANGIVLALLAVLYGIGNRESVGITAAFLGCVGSVAGDTWATAVARFSSMEPRLITSGSRVPAGTPGAVSGIGILLSGLAGVVASVLYFAVSMIVDGETTPVTLISTLSCAAIVGALAGSLFDSFLGAACQAQYSDTDGQLTDHPISSDGSSNTYIRGWRWLSNDLVNFGNSIAGAASAYFVWLAAESLKIV